MSSKCPRSASIQETHEQELGHKMSQQAHESPMQYSALGKVPVELQDHIAALNKQLDQGEHKA